jgi:hypothetical protein
VVFTVDGGPGIVTVLVDGRLCDGGPRRPAGWGRFDAEMGDVSPEASVRLGGAVAHLRVYARALRTFEAVASYRSERDR